MGMMRWAMTEGIIISGWVRVLLLHRPKWFSQFIVFEFIHAVGWFTIIKRPGQFIRTLDNREPPDGMDEQIGRAHV